MKSKNKYLNLFTGAIMTLGGFVSAGMHLLLIFIAYSIQSSSFFQNTDILMFITLFAIVVCGIAQIVHGIIIMLNSVKKQNKFSFITNIVIICFYAITILLSAISGINLMPIQMLTGIIIPVLYFAVILITAPKK